MATGPWNTITYSYHWNKEDDILYIIKKYPFTIYIHDEVSKEYDMKMRSSIHRAVRWFMATTHKSTYQSEIWQAVWQPCCRAACQISQRLENMIYKSHHLTDREVENPNLTALKLLRDLMTTFNGEKRKTNEKRNPRILLLTYTQPDQLCLTWQRTPMWWYVNTAAGVRQGYPLNPILPTYGFSLDCYTVLAWWLSCKFQPLWLYKETVKESSHSHRLFPHPLPEIS